MALFKCDGASPLTQYVNLLVAVPKSLQILIDRDAEAVRLLTSPALSESLIRAERLICNRKLSRPTPRICTRRDERRVNLRFGMAEGHWPICRTARYLRWLMRDSGSLHDQWFRLALNESRLDGTAIAIVGKLDEANRAFDDLLSAAITISQDDGGEAAFSAAKIQLGRLACELMNWTRSSGNASEGNGEPDSDVVVNYEIKAISILLKNGRLSKTAIAKIVQTNPRNLREDRAPDFHKLWITGRTKELPKGILNSNGDVDRAVLDEALNDID